jgi:hypothetical protein
VKVEDTGTVAAVGTPSRKRVRSVTPETVNTT